MEKTKNIILNSSINKKAVNENSSLSINLIGNKKVLPEDSINDTIDSYKIYLNERENSNKFRLIINLNPFCSNILFNPFTEAVKNEGTDNAVCLNFKSDKTVPGVVGKNSNFQWDEYSFIRDTQISNEVCGYDYHCGIDIFNNHIIRNKTFKSVNYHYNNSTKSVSNLSVFYGDAYSRVFVHDGKNETIRNTPHTYDGRVSSNNIKDFNTIDDYQRDRNGVIVSEQIVKYFNATWRTQYREITLPLHLYQNGDVYTFRDCIANNLLNVNGWYGFKNQSTLSLVNKGDDKNGGNLINRIINNKGKGDYIDMYPGRDLYSFVPKYNDDENRKRLEYNWKYCLTYPSENLLKTKNGSAFPFLRLDSDDSEKTSLKVYMFDEGTVDDNGNNVLTIYSVCQHGLTNGDRVNIYKSNELFYESTEVIHIIDKYIFQVYKDDGNMSKKWIEVEDRVKINGNSVCGLFEYNGSYYPVCESNRCNIDEEAQDIHFRKVVNGVECKYYVRKFSRLPNFKFRDEEVNDYTLYGSGGDLIRKFSNPASDKTIFESHIAKLGFANTIYGDDSVEIVFTDDIDISYLKDNLNRPLSEIYLTIVKNNKGYKEWYGIGESINEGSSNVEYSHCFGKIHDSFVLSDYYREKYNNAKLSVTLYDVRDLSYSSDCRDLGGEIDIETEYDYFGDICCYSPIDCKEQSIQMSMHRFNTVQRELGNINNAMATSLFDGGVLYYDELKDDENTSFSASTYNYGDPYDFFIDGTLKHSTKEKYDDMLKFNEGYFYQPHYKIQLKTVSKSISYGNGIQYEINEIENAGSNKVIFKTSVDNYFSKNDKAVLYKKSTNEYYFIAVKELLSCKKFVCSISNENGENISTSLINGLFYINNIDDYIIVKPSPDTPSYARMIKDGSCRFAWRNVVSNGIENDIKTYPFTNGAFYIQRQINFYLRRQDPDGSNGSCSNVGFNFVPAGEDISNYYNLNSDSSYEADEIESC